MPERVIDLTGDDSEEDEVMVVEPRPQQAEVRGQGLRLHQGLEVARRGAMAQIIQTQKRQQERMFQQQGPPNGQARLTKVSVGQQTFLGMTSSKTVAPLVAPAPPSFNFAGANFSGMVIGAGGSFLGNVSGNSTKTITTEASQPEGFLGRASNSRAQKPSQQTYCRCQDPWHVLFKRGELKGKPLVECSGRSNGTLCDSGKWFEQCCVGFSDVDWSAAEGTNEWRCPDCAPRKRARRSGHRDGEADHDASDGDDDNLDAGPRPTTLEQLSSEIRTEALRRLAIVAAHVNPFPPATADDIAALARIWELDLEQEGGENERFKLYRLNAIYDGPTTQRLLTDPVTVE